MAYEGQELHACLAQAFNFHYTNVIVVTGAVWNFCGHTMLNAGEHYFHVAGVHARPKYMDEAGYRRYLRETGKREMKRQRIVLPYPERAQAKLDELLSNKWKWGVVPNNCSTFVEQIVKAGGSNTGLYFNCPTQEGWA